MKSLEPSKNPTKEGFNEQLSISVFPNTDQQDRELDMLTDEQLNYLTYPVNVQVFTAFTFRKERAVSGDTGDINTTENCDSSDTKDVAGNNNTGDVCYMSEDIAEFFPFMRSTDFPYYISYDHQSVNQLYLDTTNPYSFERNRNQAAAYALAQANPQEFYDFPGYSENETNWDNESSTASSRLNSREASSSDITQLANYTRLDRAAGLHYASRDGKAHEKLDLNINIGSVKVVPTAHNSVGIEDLPEEVKYRMNKRSYRSNLPTLIENRSDGHIHNNESKGKSLKPSDYLSLKVKNVPIVEFNYHNFNVAFRSDIENAKLPSDIYFFHENCVYPGALKSKDEYSGSRWTYERECNKIAWEIVSMNPHIQGHKGVVQKAVNAIRNSGSNTKFKKGGIDGRSRARSPSFDEILPTAKR